jgi:hypothetical protein
MLRGHYTGHALWLKSEHLTLAGFVSIVAATTHEWFEYTTKDPAAKKLALYAAPHMPEFRKGIKDKIGFFSIVENEASNKPAEIATPGDIRGPGRFGDLW